MITKPESFILSTAFATLKNDDSGMATVTIPGSTVIAGSTTAAGTSADFYTDLVIGQQGAITRTQISSSKDSNKLYAMRTVAYNRIGSSSRSYDIYCFVWRISATTVRCQVHIYNPYSTSLTCASGDETITFNVVTFVPPFA